MNKDSDIRSSLQIPTPSPLLTDRDHSPPAMDSPPNPCGSVPPLLSSFIDTFVDFSVSGLFLLTPTTTSPLPTHLPAPSRLVAIGDLHGDLPKTLSALSLAGLADPYTSRWTGGPSVAVQIGDVLDRGGDELRILYLLHRLKTEAARAGGSLLTLHGNHEVMNMEGDFSFVTPSGLAEFSNWARWFRAGIAMKKLCPDITTPANPFHGIPKSFPGVRKEYWEGFRARIAALRPDGPIATRFLADNQTAIIVGDSVFVHGGLLDHHINYGLEKINAEVRDWVNGAGLRSGSPAYMNGSDSLVWLRRFSRGMNCDCAQLERLLAMMPGVKRMVMGHTIQEEGINGVCGGQAIRIDVGMSKGCGNGLPEVLEINGGGAEVRVLTTNPVYARPRYESAIVGGEAKEGLVRESRTKEVRVVA